MKNFFNICKKKQKNLCYGISGSPLKVKQKVTRQPACNEFNTIDRKL
jgi:hypothetical protein